MKRLALAAFVAIAALVVALALGVCDPPAFAADPPAAPVDPKDARIRELEMETHGLTLMLQAVQAQRNHLADQMQNQGAADQVTKQLAQEAAAAAPPAGAPKGK